MTLRSCIVHIAILVAAVFLLADGFSVAPTVSAKSTDDQPKYALLVGISKYKDRSLNPIDGCENNVPLLAETLINSYGFKKGDVHILLNDQAGKNAILGEFRSHLIENARKAKQQGKEAIVLYYFCGHGSQYPDQDGDENDGLDETFVAYDSRTGSTPDILDDEIDDLKAELRPLTTNTTLIFESCHSGTGSRGDDGGKEFTSEEADEDKQVYPPYKRKYPPSTDADADTYTEIAASASTNTAKSETREYCNCEKPYSLMTKALVEALNRANYSTTYRSLVREISSVVATRSCQDPQVEGNRDTLLFGGAAKRTKPYIEIDRLLPNDQIVIRAGTVHGLKEGSQVAVYSSTSTTDTGDADWLTNGVVKEVRAFQSVIQLPTAKENVRVSSVSVSSHVVLTSPVYGGGPVVVSLDIGPQPTRTKTIDPLATEVQKLLKTDRLVDEQTISIVPQLTTASVKNAGGVIRLRKNKFAVAFPARMLSLANMPKPKACSIEEGKVVPETVPAIAPGDDVYYLDDGSPGGTPLYGRFFLSADKTAAAEIVRLIRNYALRSNLEKLTNSASSLPSEISITVDKVSNVEVATNCNNGLLERGIVRSRTSPLIQVVNNGRLPVGTIFSFKVKNISGDIKRKKDPYASGEPLYVTAIYLLVNGDIDVIYPRLGANDPLGDGVEKTIGGYIASKPAGAEHLILIVSKAIYRFRLLPVHLGQSRRAITPRTPASTIRNPNPRRRYAYPRRTQPMGRGQGRSGYCRVRFDIPTDRHLSNSLPEPVAQPVGSDDKEYLEPRAVLARFLFHVAQLFQAYVREFISQFANIISVESAPVLLRVAAILNQSDADTVSFQYCFLVRLFDPLHDHKPHSVDVIRHSCIHIRHRQIHCIALITPC